MRRLRAVAAGLALLALAGCASIPTTGGVNAGEVQDAGDDTDIAFVPAGPVQDATPETVVSSFIAAALGTQDDYRVARQFLTPEFAKRWQPGERVLLYESRGEPVVTGESAVYTVQAVGAVDRNGVYDAFLTPQTQQLRFTVVEDAAGQWRIADGPDGVVLARNVFLRLFTPTELHFFDPTGTRLVPDSRWFPVRGDLVDAAVRALVAGPAKPLGRPVTQNGFPADARVSTSVVQGTATVDLRVAERPPTAQVRRMQTQLEETLGSVPGVQSVELELNGVDAGAAPLAIEQAPQPQPQPLVLRDDAFGYLSGGRLQPEALFAGAVVAARPNAITVSRSQGIAVLLTGRGVEVVTRGAETARVVDSRSGLVDPALDPRGGAGGYVWSVPRERPGALQVLDVQGRRVDFSTALLPGATAVRAIEVSRDGTRLLALVERDTGSVVVVAGIERAENGAPTGLSVDRFLYAVPGGEAIDATWADISGSQFAVLLRAEDGDAVTVQRVGGASREQGRLVGAVALVGGASLDDLTAFAASAGEPGELRTLSLDGIWELTATNVDVLAVQR